VPGPVPPVVFPDVVELVVDALRAGFTAHGNAAGAGNELPKTRPAAGFVLVRRIGGPRRDLVTDSAQLRLEASAPTKPAASDLAQLARALVHAMEGRAVDGVAVYRIGEFAGPQDLPDPVSPQIPRYVFTVLVDARGTAL
jgi:hypothetical protein